MIDVSSQFPILTQRVHGQRLAYLDSAASTQKPLVVIEAMNHCLREDYSNIHRGVHLLSQRLTSQYELVRQKVASFINAPTVEQIIFTKGTTDGMNLLASSLGAHILKPGDKILITAMEHHANIVPWQMACQRFGAELVVVPMDERGALIIDDFADLLSGVKIFSIAHISNALGTVNDIAPLIAQAKAVGAITIVDGAQAVAHAPIDVQSLDCDFYLFSAHKLYGPTGVGILFGRKALLEAIPPYQGGGDMILSVSFERTEYAPIPHKFEAGTPPIVEVIGLGAAIDWLTEQGLATLATHEERLRSEAETQMTKLNGLNIIGQAPHKAAVISFTIDGVHPHDAGTVFDQMGVAVRVGHHCAEPVMRHFGIPATIRASFAAYNNSDDIEQLLMAIKATQELFA